MPNKFSSRDIIYYATISGAATLVALIVGYALLKFSRLGIGDVTERRIYYVLLIVLGMAGSALVFGAMKATASFKGQQFGAVLELGGPVVALFLLPIVGFWLTSPPSEFDLTVNLRGVKPGDDIAKVLSLTVDVEGRREPVQFNPTGQAIIRALPSRLRGAEALFEFQSDLYSADGLPLKFVMKEPFVFAIALNRAPDAILQRRREKVKLLEKFDQVVMDIDQSLLQRDGRLFVSGPRAPRSGTGRSVA